MIYHGQGEGPGGLKATLMSKAHFWACCASPKPPGKGNPRKAEPDRALVNPLSLQLPPHTHIPPKPSPQQGFGPHSRCTTACTAQRWGVEEASVTVHLSLWMSNACRPMEQKISKKDSLLLAALQSACGDKQGLGTAAHAPGAPQHHAPSPGWRGHGVAGDGKDLQDHQPPPRPTTSHH